MHFRERDKIIQVIRTRYDAGAKRARAEIVGRLDKARPQITEEMRQRCSPAELAEIGRWIAEGAAETRVGAHQRVAAVRRQLDALAEWLHEQPPSEEAEACIQSLFEHWRRFRRQLLRQGRTLPSHPAGGGIMNADQKAKEPSGSALALTVRRRSAVEGGTP